MLDMKRRSPTSQSCMGGWASAQALYNINLLLRGLAVMMAVEVLLDETFPWQMGCKTHH